MIDDIEQKHVPITLKNNNFMDFDEDFDHDI